MSHTPHELGQEFPEFSVKLTELKQTNPRFAKLADDYHLVNRKIHRAETNVAPMDDLAEGQLRKTRAGLKDEIYALLTAE